MKLNMLIQIYNPTKKLCDGGLFDNGGKITGIDNKIEIKESSTPNEWIFTITYADRINEEKVWRKYPNYVSEKFATKNQAMAAAQKRVKFDVLKNSFSEGGKINEGEEIMIDSWHMETVEDDYNQGESIESVQYYFENKPQFFDSVEKLIKYVEKSIIYIDKFKENAIVYEDGRIDISIMVAKDNSDSFFPASKSELEKWKKGEMKLYTSHYILYINIVKKTKPSVEKISKMFGIQTT